MVGVPSGGLVRGELVENVDVYLRSGFSVDVCVWVRN